MFVQGIRSCHSFWKLQPSNPYQKLLHHAYPFIAASGQNQSHAEKQRVWSQSCGLQDMLYTILWLCSQLCYEIAANQRTLVQIELLATVGWTCGCQPFSCQCSQNVMHCRKVINATSLFKESIPALYIYIHIPFGNPMLHRICVCCYCRRKPVLCREAEGLVAELWSPRFVTIQWLCSRLCYEIAANQRTLVQIELLATASWKWGCRPFSCQCSQNVMHCRKVINATSLFKESIPSIPCVNSKHPVPTRSLRFFLRAAACSTGSALWLHHA